MVEKLYLAKPRGYCAGVVMAIDAVKDAARSMRHGGTGELTVYHSIVHNSTVVERLEREEGVHFVEDLREVEQVERSVNARGATLSDTVVFSAHGVSPEVRRTADALGLATIDATCPLVTKVHSEARKYARLGYHILLIGDSLQHQEIIGTAGHAPAQTTVVRVAGLPARDDGLADAETVEVPDPDKVCVLTQTTLNVDLTMKTIAILRRRFPSLVIPSRDDLCYATKNRQDAVRRIGDRVDLFLVVSSNYSSNGMRLFELAREVCGRAIRVEGLDDLRESELQGATTVGITSAASTPEDLVQDLVEHFRRLNPALEVIEDGEWESIRFRKPKRVPAPGATGRRP